MNCHLLFYHIKDNLRNILSKIYLNHYFSFNYLIIEKSGLIETMV